MGSKCVVFNRIQKLGHTAFICKFNKCYITLQQIHMFFL